MSKEQAEASCEEYGGTMLDFDGLARVGLHHLDDFLKTHTRFWTNITWVNDTISVWYDPLSGTSKELNISGVTVFDEGSCTILEFVFTHVYPIRLYKVKCSDPEYSICSAAPEKIKNLPNSTSQSTVTLPDTTTPLPTTTRTLEHRTLALITNDLECPHGYNWKEDSSTGYCYWETSYETTKLSWNSAREYCQSYGGDLASFHNMQEERIGLSFQYGQIAHPYWMGLMYDTEQEKYVWADGSPLTYQNWAKGEPDHSNLRLRCVQMNAVKKEWNAAYCGVRSWFICKAPKMLNPSRPVVPTMEPLQSCVPTSRPDSENFYFYNGYCYVVIPIQYDWHRARLFCQNRDSDLVSVHSEGEVDFLIRVIYEERSILGNRVWMGLTSLGLDDQLAWIDGTLLDFVHWNKDEPNNYLNQEKCCTMYIGNGLWNDENCNSIMSFVCKRKNGTSDTTTVPPIPTPAPGNCKKGWYAFGDLCYLPVGERKKDRANFTAAQSECTAQGGSLASIHDAKEQVFLTFLMQNIKANTWIGLHDKIQSGTYFWMDNTALTYTNWALGEPSLFGMQEDCVLMQYKHDESGLWKDHTCDKEFPYICQSSKDPSVTSPWISRATRCIQPEGWLKHGYSCFKLFNESKIWLEAMDTCNSYGGRLVSVSDFSMQAVFKYLAIDYNVSIWIGLRVNMYHKFEWMNDWPMNISNWDSLEPSTKNKVDWCFTSSPSGFWKKSNCQEKYPFMCQINAESPPPKEKTPKICSSPSFQAVEGDEDYCYNMEEWLRGYDAYFQCFIQGGQLISIHSENQVNALKTYVERAANREIPFFIGLSKNKKGGFAWADGSPVDFEYWEEGEPQDTKDMCVEMKAQTLKWRVVSCLIRKNAICSLKKISVPVVELNFTTGEQSSHHAPPETDSGTGLSGGVVAVIILSILVIFAASVVVYFYLKPPGSLKHFRLRSTHHQVTSFENALYDADSTLELQEEHDSNSAKD